MSETTASAEHLRQAVRRAKTRQSADMTGFAASALLRAVAFCVGAACFVTSVGLWAFPSVDATLMLIKVGASILFFGGAAIFTLMAVAPHDLYHLEFDPRAQEFRVLERDETGQFFVQATHALSEIEKLRFEAGALRAWHADGTTLMAVPMRARSAREMINAVLKTTPKRRTAA